MKTPTQKSLACLIAMTVAMMATFFIGCATSPTDDPASPTGDLAGDLAFELFTQVAVAEALGSDRETAQTVVLVSGLILDGLESGELVIPEQVETAIKDLVIAADLEPSSQQAVLILVDLMAANYLARINAGQLDPNVTAPLTTIIGWVNTAANNTLRFGGRLNYGEPPLPVEQRAQLGNNEATFLAKVIAFLLFEWLSGDEDEADSITP